MNPGGAPGRAAGAASGNTSNGAGKTGGGAGPTGGGAGPTGGGATNRGQKRAQAMRRGGGGALRLARLARGLTQDQLATAAGVTRQAIAGVESGRWDPSLRVAMALAGALGVGVEELFAPGEGGTVVAVHLAEIQPWVGADGIGDRRPVRGAGGGPPRGGPSTGGPPAERRAAVTAAGPHPGGPHLPVRLALAEIRGRLVGLPLLGDPAGRAGFAAAGALWPGGLPDATGAVSARALAVGRRTLVVAGCDPALPLLAEPLSRAEPPIDLLWWSCSSDAALHLVARGLAHVAGVHRPPRSSAAGASSPPADQPPEAPLAPGWAEHAQPGGRALRIDADVEVVGFASWAEGLATHPTLAGGVRDLTDVAGRGLRLVNREPGAQARALLDRELARLGLRPEDLDGYPTASTGHLPVAAAIRAGLGAVGVVCEPAAVAFGLDFTAWTVERSELVIPRDLLGQVEVQALLRVLGGKWLRTQLAALDGYDPAICGEVGNPG